MIQGVYSGGHPDVLKNLALNAYDDKFEINISMRERIGHLDPEWTAKYLDNPGPRGVYKKSGQIYIGANLLRDGAVKYGPAPHDVDVGEMQNRALHELSHFVDFAANGSHHTSKDAYKQAYVDDLFHSDLLAGLYKYLSKNSQPDNGKLETAYQNLISKHQQQNAASGAPAINPPATLREYIENSMQTSFLETQEPALKYLEFIQAKYESLGYKEHITPRLGEDISNVRNKVLLPHKAPTTQEPPEGYKVYANFASQMRESFARFIEARVPPELRNVFMPNLTHRFKTAVYPETAATNKAMESQPKIQEKRAKFAKILARDLKTVQKKTGAEFCEVAFEVPQICIYMTGESFNDTMAKSRSVQSGTFHRTHGTTLEGTEFKVKFDEGKNTHYLAIEGLDVQLCALMSAQNKSGGDLDWKAKISSDNNLSESYRA